MFKKLFRVPPAGSIALVDTALGGASGSPFPPRDYLLIDAKLGEKRWSDEEALTERIAELVQRSISDRYPKPGTARRDAHPKSHGCVHAQFVVEPALPLSLAQGVFVPGVAYKAWLRFSNGNGDPTRPDSDGDGRGVGIKLMGVPGNKLLASEVHANTQDFVLMTHPTFFADDPARYAALIERGTSASAFVAATAPLALGWKGMWIAKKMRSKRIASPLEERYWSTVPFSHGSGAGRRAVKYSIRPSVVGVSTIPRNPRPDYLREAMEAALATGEAHFDFLIQVRVEGMSVEDSRVEWLENEAPFVKVATIIIPSQIFNTPAQDAFGEALSFTPWHALPEHRPLGGVNRIRKVVYEAVSELRHRLNGTERREPTGDERFDPSE